MPLRTMVFLFASLVGSLPALAVDVLQEVEGPEDGGFVLDHPGPGGQISALATLAAPDVTGPRYAIRGEIKYEGVRARSYLEMWNHFGEAKFFSRTLAPEGPAGVILGDSDWRRFVLPFFNTQPGAPPPDKLEFNLALAGAGRVEIREVELVQFDEGESPLQEPGAWLSPRQVGLFGGALGGLLGLCGALIAFLSTRRQARGLVILLLAGMVFVGLAGLVLGVAGSLQHQPWLVLFIGYLLAAVGLCIPLGLGRLILARYRF